MLYSSKALQPATNPGVDPVKSSLAVVRLAGQGFVLAAISTDSLPFLP